MQITLSQLQHTFKRALCAPQIQSDVADLNIQAHFPPSVQDRFSIYREDYIHRILEWLQNDFKRSLCWVEESSHEELVRGYLEAYPSTYHCLAEIGRHFPEFLDSILQPGDPKFLPDLARLEWAIVCAKRTSGFIAEIRPFSQVDQVDPGAISLCLNPSLTLFTSEWPVDKLKRPSGTVAFRECTRLAVYQYFGEVRVDRMRSRQWELLARIETGAKMAEILDWMCENGLRAEQTQNWFKKWVERGILSGFVS